MHKIVILVLGILVVGAAGVAVVRYLGGVPQEQVPVISSTDASPIPHAEAPVALAVEEFVNGLSVPWSIVFTSPDRMLVTERPGQVRVIENGQLLQEPIASYPEVYSQSEDGLMGMALDPAYPENRYVYLSMSYQKNGNEVVKVVRVKDEGSSFSPQEIVIDDIPAARVHAGNRLAFGPDGKLYITTGDAAERALAQRMDSLAGKTLRINPDGSIPDDNPFPNSPVYSLGHRNSQGMDWHPVTGNLYATEHGPSGFDGPGGGDEVNWVQAGKNYGWPVVSHDRNQDEFIAPLLTYTPAVAPAGAIFYRGTQLPQLTNTFLFGGLRGQGIFQVVIDPDDPAAVLRHGKLAEVDVGRVRALVEGPDGYVYFSSSNQDGRGDPRPGDDIIYRLVPRAR